MAGKILGTIEMIAGPCVAFELEPVLEDLAVSLNQGESEFHIPLDHRCQTGEDILAVC